MLARISYAVAAVVVVAGLLGLALAARTSERTRLVLASGAPAVLYLPRDAERPLPLVVLAHGYGGNLGVVGSLARRLSAAGLGVLSLDLPGHGAHPARLEGGGERTRVDLEAALDLAISRTDLDASRVALVGFGRGANASLAQAQWNPAQVATVVAIGATRVVEGPYDPPSALILWGSLQGTAARRAGRSIGAQLAGRSQLVADRTYGSLSTGDAVRISEIDGIGTLGAPYASEVARQVLDWLRLALARPDRAAPGGRARASRDPALPWAWLALAGAGVLWFGAAGQTRPGQASASARSTVGRAASGSAGLARLGVWLASLLAAAALVWAADPMLTGGWARFVSVEAGRSVAAWLALSGLPLLAWLRRAGELRSELLAQPSTWGGAVGLFALGYVLLGTALSPWVDLYPTTSRLSAVAAIALLSLPHFAAQELALRSPGWLGTALPLAARLATVGVLLGVGALGPASPGVLGCALLLGLAAVPLEIAAGRIARVRPNPWQSALLQALWTGWWLGTLMPLTR